MSWRCFRGSRQCRHLRVEVRRGHVAWLIRSFGLANVGRTDEPVVKGAAFEQYALSEYSHAALLVLPLLALIVIVNRCALATPLRLMKIRPAGDAVRDRAPSLRGYGRAVECDNRRRQSHDQS